jgi:aminoacrylate hydrolase
MGASRSVEMSDGARLSVLVDGDAARPALLLVSGLSGTAGFWDPIVPLLTPHLRLVRLDQRGVASSTRGNRITSIDLLAEDCLAILDAIGVQRPLLLGHSTGGVILQSMALQRPGAFAGLILSATWARPGRYMTELFNARRSVLDAVPKAYAALTPFLGYPPDWIDRNWPQVSRMMTAAPAALDQQRIMAERITALMEFDRSGEIAGIREPVLIQGAEDDLIVPAFLQRELRDLMPGSELAMLPSGGHFFPVSRSTDFVANVAAFARSIGHI